MAERLEDLNLPNTVITRIIKDALPDGVNVAKEARTAFAKSASVYILYITSAASLVATSNNRKTISGQDVLQAIGNVEFNKFLEPLEDVLECKFTCYTRLLHCQSVSAQCSAFCSLLAFLVNMIYAIIIVNS
jgi:DNA polymerase epsilon subunit 3